MKKKKKINSKNKKT